MVCSRPSRAAALLAAALSSGAGATVEMRDPLLSVQAHVAVAANRVLPFQNGPPTRV